jgi:hypothetical protein
MMNRARITAAFAATTLVAAVLGLATTSAAASQTTMLQGTFTIQFPKGHAASNAPCPADAFCGVGALAGYGTATITILDESVDEIAGSSCFAVTRVEQIDLLGESGSLVLDSTGTFCRPGGSDASHASPNSYGSPGRFDLTFTVNSDESSGAFAGATGAGTETMYVDGGIGVWHLTGTLVGA